MRRICMVVIWCVLALSIAMPNASFAQEVAEKKVFPTEELDQMLAPIALYPDSLLSQVLMASTYPLEVVQADRWAKQKKGLKGDALAEAMEKQEWDPSVKSLIQFPDVLAMMSEKLDWTQKLGDVFLSQQEDVMNTVQKLRKKAEDAGNLKSTKEQVVKVEKEVIVIESANPKVVYVPVYNPTVVYGTWWWPSYPPYYYYPAYYPRPAAFGFAAGVAVGVAWGYAWGHFDWHHHHVQINVNRNININTKINRNKYIQNYGRGDGNWKHDPVHRKGVSYRDQKTAKQFNRAGTNDAIRSRENFRGRAEKGGKDISRADSKSFGGSSAGGNRALEGKGKVPNRDMSKTRDVRQTSGKTGDMSGSRDIDRGGLSGRADRGSAFSGMDSGGRATRDFSSRGSSSRQRMSLGGSRGGRGRR